MQSRTRVLTVAAAAVAPLLLVTACGGAATDAGTSGNLTPIQGSSYVTIEPATTTTTTTLAPGEEAAIEPGQTSPSEQVYTVVTGDSVFKIASLYELDPEVLANYNSWPEGIQHPLFVGDTVRIPPDSIIPVSGGAAADSGDPTDAIIAETETSDQAAGGCTHTVVEGDNPSRLANQYDVTLDELNAANASNPAYTRFLIGDAIIIPEGGDC